MNNIFRLSAAVVLTAMIFLPEAALATCKNGICAVSTEEGSNLLVQFSTQVAHSHYNFNAGGGQRELGANETQVSIPIPSGRPQIIHYSFQACTGGGFMSKSSCTPWANFTHTVH